MSFMGGPECSTGSNPLAQFTKHTGEDKSLQRDRLAGQGPPGLQEGFRTHQNGRSQDQVSHAGAFLQSPFWQPQKHL